MTADLEAKIRAQLAAWYDSPAEIERYMTSPQKLLGGEIPLDLIRAGRGDEILQVLAQLEAGTQL